MFSFFKTTKVAGKEFTTDTFLASKVLEIENIPRKVKLDRTMRAIWALLVAFFLAWTITLFLGISGQPKKDVNDLVFGIVVLLVTSGFIFQLVYTWRDRNLLRNGIFTVGTVVARKKVKVRRGSNSVITYSFPVGPGKPMIGQGTDHTKNYSENSPLLVCFDPNDISRNLALCCTYWRVRDRDGKLFEP